MGHGTRLFVIFAPQGIVRLLPVRHDADGEKPIFPRFSFP
jgi:hypothetical protein